MRDPAKHRLHDYEENWLAVLLRMGVASEKDLRAAQGRVTQQAIDEMDARRQRRKRRRRRRE